MLERLQSDATTRGTALAILVCAAEPSTAARLTGVLNLLGVAAPASAVPDEALNPAVSFEAQPLSVLQEDLLEALGSGVHDALPLAADWSASQPATEARAALTKLLEDACRGEALCLFNDPRIGALLPLWTDALARTGRATGAVLAFADPLAGAEVEEPAPERGRRLFLWLRRLLEAERSTRGLPRSVVLPADLATDWRATTAKIGRDLRLTWPRDVAHAAAAIDAFLAEGSAGNQHAELDLASPLEALCAEAWAALQGLAHTGKGAAFDAVAARLDNAIALTGPVLASLQAGERDLRAANARLEAGVELRDLHLAEADRRVAQRDRAISDRDALIEEARGAAEELARERALAANAAALSTEHAQAHQAVIEGYDAILQGHLSVVQDYEYRAEILRGMAVQERRLAAEARIAYARASERAQALQELVETALRQGEAEANAEIGRLGGRIDQLEAQLARIRDGGYARLRRRVQSLWWGMRLRLPALRAWQAAEAAARERERISARAVSLPWTPPAEELAPPPPPLEPAPAVEPPTSVATPVVITAPQPARRVRIAPRSRLSVVFVSGEPTTPGHAYRIRRWADAVRSLGGTAYAWSREDAVEQLDEIAHADMLFVWRVPWGEELKTLVEAARAAGTPVVYDVDDLMFEPQLATVKLIDGIRSQQFDENEVRAFYAKFAEAIAHADYCTAPTHVLAARMRRLWKPGFVLPNGFEEETFRRSRIAARRARAAADGLVRIGYATGSKTHQKDFAQCAEAVADVLRARPQARLVLFKAGETQVMDLDEFPAFDELRDQVEWRQMVPIDALPDEIARFDISIAPLEVGNIFCEAKSELKFFESALAGAVTVASPTDPFRRAMRDGETGFFAADPHAWREILLKLVDAPELRVQVARAALYDSLADYGPERRAEIVQSLADQLAGSPRRGARAFELDLRRRLDARRKAPHVPAHEVVFEADRFGAAEVTVVVPLYNYARFVEEALDSVAAQTLEALDLVVIDDGSTDDSLAVARAWIERRGDRFNRALLIRNRANSGLAFTRNVGFANAETRFVLPLDADNRLAPEICEQALAAAEDSGAAFVYARMRQFGDGVELMGDWRYDPVRLISGNYIDAMALIRLSAWADVGGYDHIRYGWEDYDLWCRFAERGLFGDQLYEVLGGYRVHGGSMLRTQTDMTENKRQLIAELERRHPWLTIDRPSELDEWSVPPE